jgi:hypothetical protein
MTAEIAILNKSAVALAADSAVTFSIGGERQVFQTVNKLFSLSKYHPVGVMVYGNAEFMDVDWETIVKIYRNALSKRSFDSLHEHAIHFVRFLQTNVELFDERCQQDFIERRLTAEFTSMRDDVLKKIHQIIEQQGKITSSEIRDTMRSVAMERHVYLRNHGKIKTVDGSDRIGSDRIGSDRIGSDRIGSIER